MTGPAPGEEFFAADKTALAIYRSHAAAMAPLAGVQVVMSKSQVAFRARRGFAYAWAPGRYVRSDVPVVVSFALREELRSPRIKEVAHSSPDDVDAPRRAARDGRRRCRADRVGHTRLG